MDKPLTTEEKARLFRTLDEQSATLAQLMRGMYGDEKNGVPGLMNDMKFVMGWISKTKVKITIISTIAATIGFILNKGWEYFTHK